MATCNNVSLIYDSECIGESLIKINTNFTNLDIGLCELGQNLLSLEAFVRSLSAKDSPTVDLTFSPTSYYLQADVVNSSLGTIKLGVDIPTTTKQFLTAVKVSSLIDTNINNPQTGELLLWNGVKWINQSVVDDVGAKYLNELGDVTLTAPLLNGQVLKYNSTLNQWINGTDETELVVRDGLYTDIRVTNIGKDWNIVPNAVGPDEIAPNAVTTTKIQNLAVINGKIANSTITKSKLAFTPGEINTGKNIGNGYGICVETNDSSGRIPIKSLQPSGAVSITPSTDGNTLTIRVPTATEPVGATGQNLGTGVGIFNESASTNGNLKFKTLKAGFGIEFDTTNSNEIIIKAKPLTLGLSIIGVSETGASFINDNDTIKQRIQAVYPAASYPDNTICNVEITVPQNDSITSAAVTVPFTIQYKRTGDTSSSTNFQLIDPPVAAAGGGNYTGTKNLNGTVILSNPPTLRVPTRQLKRFKIVASIWLFDSTL
jgi:hypothetical protein